VPKGVKITELEVGTGRLAGRGLLAVVKLRMFLNNGEELWADTTPPRQVIDLGRRDTVAGVRYGIEGMRSGGKRHLVISPHLAYGPEGSPGLIPPDAVLRCEVELLEVRDRGAPCPESCPSGRQLVVFSPGIAAESKPRWQFGLHESGGCGALITFAKPQYGWRYASERSATFHPDPETTATLLAEALALPAAFPDECLENESLWSDSSEPANGVTRDRRTNTPCIGITLYQDGHLLRHYSLKEDSPAWLSSRLNRTISDWLHPDLTTIPAGPSS
jgi:hypothetical protein